MYFPDLNVQVEIDEGHHNHKENIKLDWNFIINNGNNRLTPSESPGPLAR